MFTQRNLRWLRLPWLIPLIALTALVLVTNATPSTTSAQAPPNLVANGSFEIGTLNNVSTFDVLFAGSTAITGWTVVSGSIDYIGGLWEASHGSRSLDMSGNAPGSISQSFATTPGSQYQVLFGMAGNPFNPCHPTGSAIRDMLVSVGASSQSFTFDTTGKNFPTPMGWVEKQFLFVAASSNTTLTFTSQTPGCAGPAIDNVKVTLVDTTPPTVACSVTPNKLWPPNHKMVTVNASVSVSDAGSGPAGYTLVSVTSNEPDNGLGDGDQPNDIQGFVTGTADTSGQVRAERSGQGSGRVYTLTYVGMDQAGNSASCSTTVSVPHDQGK